MTQANNNPYMSVIRKDASMKKQEIGTDITSSGVDNQPKV